MSKIKKFLKQIQYNMALFRSSVQVDPVENYSVKPLTQESKKNFNISNFQMCSLTPHDIDCPVIGCQKSPCFIWTPDKIVGKPYKVKVGGSKTLKNRGT